MQGSCAQRPEEGRNAHIPVDRAIAALARRQHGVVALWQLVELGLSASAVRNRVAGGRLHREHRGVYAVGHAALTHHGHLMAATLACGPGAVVSRRSAAALWDLRVRRGHVIDISAPSSAGRRRAGIGVHSAATLDARDITAVDDIPCTTLARTFLDVAENANPREVERLVDQAEVRRLLDMRAVDDVLARADGRRGAAALRAVLAEIRLGTTLTRSELEERFLAICRDAGLAPDGVNAWIPDPAGGGAEADFVWRRQRLIVEVDGRAAHATHRAFEHDRRRDQRLTLLGWRVVRFTWRQVVLGAGLRRSDAHSAAPRRSVRPRRLDATTPGEENSCDSEIPARRLIAIDPGSVMEGRAG